MSTVFLLRPDLNLLFKHGYLYSTQPAASITLDIESISSEEKRKVLEAKFNDLCGKYGLMSMRDTLLYICLVEHDAAELKFQYVYKQYNEFKRAKELASLLLLKQSDKHDTMTIKVSTLTDTVKISDRQLVQWIGDLIERTIREQDFVPDILGNAVMSFVSDAEDVISYDHHNQLNYTNIEKIAVSAVRKPGIRERNRCLTTFLMALLKFMTEEQLLPKPVNIRYTDAQLNFLFELSVMLEWLQPFDFDSEPKDYMYTLLTNQAKVIRA